MPPSSPPRPPPLTVLANIVPHTLHTPRLTLELFNHSPTHCDIFLACINSPTAHARMGDKGIRTHAQVLSVVQQSRLLTPPFGPHGAEEGLIYVARLRSTGGEGGEREGKTEVEKGEGVNIATISLSQRSISSRILPPDLGWAVIQSHQGQGYATEAAGAVVRWAHAFGCKDLVVYPSETNRESNRVAQKLGFVVGGKIMDADFPGKWRNLLVLGGMKEIVVGEAMSFVPPPVAAEEEQSA